MNVLSKEKAQIIAQEYVTNGFHKSGALIKAGYAEKYSKTSAAGKIFEKPEVKNAIDAIMRRSAAVCDVEVDEIIAGLRLKAFPSGDAKVRDADNIRALELLGKYKLMFSERLQVGVDNPQQRELDESQKEECRKIAAIRLHQSIA